MHSTMHTTLGIPYINTQWLERLGLEMPTTMEELKAVLIAFRDQDANGNGDPNDEIPFDFCDSFNKTQLINCAASWGLPLYNGGSVFYDFDDAGNVVGAINTDAYRSFLEFFYELGQEKRSTRGLSQSYDQSPQLQRGPRRLLLGLGPVQLHHDSSSSCSLGDGAPTVEGYPVKMYTANLDLPTPSATTS